MKVHRREKQWIFILHFIFNYNKPKETHYRRGILNGYLLAGRGSFLNYFLKKQLYRKINDDYEYFQLLNFDENT